MSNTVVQLASLTKEFSVGLRQCKVRALDAVDLSIESGQIYGLLGPNGAGKSTLIKLILGLLKPSQGHVLVCGQAAGAFANRSRLGYMPDKANYYLYLTAWEVLMFYARMHGLPAKCANERVDALIDLVGLRAVIHRKLGTYSKGMLQRVGLAQALINEPDLLLLDEPISGMDPMGCELMLRIIRQLKQQGKTIIISSHMLDIMQRLCDRVALIYRGKLVTEGPVGAWAKGTENVISIRCPNDAQRKGLAEYLLKVDGAELIEFSDAFPSLNDWFMRTISANDSALVGKDG